MPTSRKHLPKDTNLTFLTKALVRSEQLGDWTGNYNSSREMWRISVHRTSCLSLMVSTRPVLVN